MLVYFCTSAHDRVVSVARCDFTVALATLCVCGYLYVRWTEVGFHHGVHGGRPTKADLLLELSREVKMLNVRTGTSNEEYLRMLRRAGVGKWYKATRGQGR